MANRLCSPSPQRGRPTAPTTLCLIPFDRREAISVEMAAEIAGRDVRTLRRWCVDRGIGRRVAGGPWAVSGVALNMLLNDDDATLRAYLAGDRRSPAVVAYFERAGLADLPRRWVGWIEA